MLVSMPKPRTTICNRGITNEKKRVEGSRRTCSVSLKNTARKPRKTLDTNALHLALVLVGELNENVLQAGGQRPDFGNGDTVFEELLAQIVQVEMVFDQRVDGLAKNGGAANAGNLPGEAQSTRDFRSGDFHALGALRLHVGQ